MFKRLILNKISQYRFEIRHIIVFFTILIIFQIVVAFIQKSALDGFLRETQIWYRKYSAERIAVVTSTSMELFFENFFLHKTNADYEKKEFIYSFNIIFKQQLLQKGFEDIFLILSRNHKLYVIDSGQKLHSYLIGTLPPYESQNDFHTEGVELYKTEREKLKSDEVIYSTLKNQNTFNILVPFVPDGEYMGVIYMRITPDFSFLTEEVSVNFNKVAIVYSSLIFIGLIAIFLISSQAVKERNDAQHKFYQEHEINLKKQIKLEKESLFTKRIYHTHHKAEKIMGFIKEDVRKMNNENLPELKRRVITYSNFISRIIYDMKWFDPEINTIINPMFHTNVNEVIKFIVKNIFLRISSKNEMFDFELNLDESLPSVNVNEFVVWEILEPLIQNSIDHGNKKSIKIIISTIYERADNVSYIIISDNGVGIKEELLERVGKGIRKIFLENESTKKIDGSNSGYGCFIAHQMAVERCGWEMDAENLDVGCKFTLIIKNQKA
jgi:anti-sigma regulatory factor (Ser/Thr protein kinase)